MRKKFVELLKDEQIEASGAVDMTVKQASVQKSRTEILAILLLFGGFYCIKWLNWKLFSYKSVCISILIQMRGKISLKVISQKMWPKWPSYGPK